MVVFPVPGVPVTKMFGFFCLPVSCAMTTIHFPVKILKNSRGLLHYKVIRSISDTNKSFKSINHCKKQLEKHDYVNKPQNREEKYNQHQL
jgi:hypothetical protein